MSAAGVGVGLIGLGMITGGMNSAAQAEFQADQMEQDAKTVKGNELIQRRQRMLRRGMLEAAQTTAVASSGVRMEGSPMDAIAFSEEQYALDEYANRKTAENQYQRTLTGAAGQRVSGAAALTGGLLGAAGTVTMGVARA